MRQDKNALGMVEYASVSSGLMAADLLSKSGVVHLHYAKPVSPGKFVVLFSGEISSVRAAIDAAERSCGSQMIDSFLLGNPHEYVLEALAGSVSLEDGRAIGLVETFTIAAAITAADVLAKTADVVIHEIRMTTDMCGKAYVMVSGSVAAVTEAVRYAADRLRSQQTLRDTVILAAPSQELLQGLRLEA